MDSNRRTTPIMSERRVGIVGACLTMIGPFSMSIYTPAMPEIVSAFGTTDEAVKMSLSLYFAGFAFAQLITGPLSDGLGRKPVTVGFIAIYTLASLIAVFAPNIETLIAARVLQGVGAAVGIAMARAIVRDLYTHDQAARIMNLIGTILSIGPAIAPTIGGLVMELFGWHMIFLVMAAAGVSLILLTVFVIRETVTRDVSRIQPAALVRSYRSLLSSPYFVTACLANAGSVGAIYAQATMLPFVLMNAAGLTPTQFGLAMLMQSGGFFLGTLALRQLMHRHSAASLVPAGLVLLGIGGLLLAVLLRVSEPTFATVMGPVAIFAFGVPFVTAAMTTAAMAPFGRNAGAASALLGFIQMGGGLAGGALAALMGDATTALSTIIPIFALTGIVSWLVWRRLPDPSRH